MGCFSLLLIADNAAFLKSATGRGGVIGSQADT